MTAAAYYNEFDPYAAQWLRNLIAAGHIAPGDVDERSITEVHPDDLRGYAQCHFFAGIGGWSLALRLAGWDDARPVWTGSCPCQPFSAAGKGEGFADARHLWPVWAKLIGQCRPAVVFGEQVEAAIRLGWLDLVQDDLEGLGYAFGRAGLPAACVGAPHIRQRLWFVADAGSAGTWRNTGAAPCTEAGGSGAWRADGSRRGDLLVARGATGLVADSSSARPQGHEHPGPGTDAQRATAERGGDAGALADDDAAGFGGLALVGLRRAAVHDADGRGAGFVGDADGDGWRQGGRAAAHGGVTHCEGAAAIDGHGSSSHWSDLEWLPCRDGKARPTQPGLQPLAHGVPARVGKLRAAGNAIVPQVAAEFIRAFDDVRQAA